MSRAKITSMADDVVRLHQALAAALKGVRTLAERLKKDTPEERVREQLEKVLSRPGPGQKKPPAQSKKERPGEGERRLRKFGRALAALSEDQLHLVMGLARSMVQRHPKGGQPQNGTVPLKNNRSNLAGGDLALPSPHTPNGMD